jgi:hypothetical protein
MTETLTTFVKHKQMKRIPRNIVDNIYFASMEFVFKLKYVLFLLVVGNKNILKTNFKHEATHSMGHV